MDPPAPETLMRALELLNYLGAIDDEGSMTTVSASSAALQNKPDGAQEPSGDIRLVYSRHALQS